MLFQICRTNEYYSLFVFGKTVSVYSVLFFKASRAVILRRAIEVIEEKQQQRADLKADCDRLRSEMAELEREVCI